MKQISTYANFPVPGDAKELYVDTSTNISYRWTGSDYAVVAAAATATNDNAAAGSIGEYVSASVAPGSAVSLTTATDKNVTSISLTAGDWDVCGTVDFALTGATATDAYAGISTTTDTLGGQDTYSNRVMSLTAVTDTIVQPTPLVRLSLAATTTVYLVAKAEFSAGTEAAYGSIRARRAR